MLKVYPAVSELYMLMSLLILTLPAWVPVPLVVTIFTLAPDCILVCISV